MSEPPEQTSPTSSGPLFSRAFIAVTLNAFVFFFYIGMVLVVLPRFIELKLGAGEFGIGLSLAFFAVAAIIVRPLLGPMTNRYGRRAMMFGGTMMAGLAGGAIGFTTELWQVLVLRVIMGLGEAGLFVAASTLIADLSPPTRRAEAASYFSVSVYTGIGVGPAVGEWILGDGRYTLTFLVAGGLACVASLIVLAVPARVDRSISPPANAGKQPILHRRALAPGLVLASGMAAFSVYSAFIPEHSRAVGLAGAAGLYMLYSLTSVSLRIVGAKVPERLGERRMGTVALTSLSVSLLLIGAVAQPWALWAGAVGLGIGMAFLYPSLMANVVARAKEHERATALSTLTMFFEVGTMVGGVVLGGIGDLLNKQAGFIGGSVIAAMGLVVLWQFVVPAIREQAASGDVADAAQARMPARRR